MNNIPTYVKLMTDTCTSSSTIRWVYFVQQIEDSENHFFITKCAASDRGGREIKMSLKTDIEKIFSDNTNYANPSQAVNQASSLNALSGDLYTDSKRFIYELLQNADDSSQNNEAVKVWIKILDDNLVVAHSGRPFTTRDLQGICNVNNGTKKSDLNDIYK
ncbi:hypothetical protein [Desulfosporosinus sp. I2]|uniref:sacsin N-terminal ATP-binding-like domain-containing protein n=1 Tax=Desulfosporosinus sp. I2 TaxID=1617025 RepID=UPI000A4E7C44|nr:hypothetical protein [Desulfosporosinus sp. I2]